LQVRNNFFTCLIIKETAINQALDFKLDKQRVVSMGKLEGVLGNVLDKIFQEDRREERRKDKQRRDMIKSAMARDEPEALIERQTTFAQPEAVSAPLLVPVPEAPEITSVGGDNALEDPKVIFESNTGLKLSEEISVRDQPLSHSIPMAEINPIQHSAEIPIPAPVESPIPAVSSGAPLSAKVLFLW